MSNLITTNKLEQIKNEFYSENGGKNLFFKNKQKFEIANQICKTFDVKDLLSESMYIIPNKRCIYFNYELVKMFLTQDIGNEIFNHMVDIYDSCIRDYGKLVIHININSLTISAAERYKTLIIAIIQNLEKRSITSNVCYSDYIENITFYNIPSFLHSFILFFKPYVAKDEVFNKITLYKKNESEQKLNELFVK